MISTPAATTAVTIGGVAAGAFACAVWFSRVLRRRGLRVRLARI